MKIVALLPKDEEGQYENQLLSDYNALGLEDHLGEKHDLVVINRDEDVDNHLEDVEVIISSPFLPAYVTKERQEKAKNLKLAITAGVGSDHVDLDAANDNGISVVEVTGSNQVSTAEHAVLTIILLLRNFQEGNRQARAGEWNLPKVGHRAYDVENKTIGIMGYGKIGKLVAERLKPFNVEIQHYDPEEDEDTELSTAVSFEKLLATSDVITLHSPLTDSTEGLFDKDTLDEMKDGAYLVNVARGAIVDKEALAKALESNKLNGYGGDVWNPQPASSDHIWRNLPETRSAMVPHMGGMTIDAQERIQKGVQELLDHYINNEPFPEEHIIVDEGTISSSYTVE